MARPHFAANHRSIADTARDLGLRHRRHMRGRQLNKQACFCAPGKQGRIRLIRLSKVRGNQRLHNSSSTSKLAIREGLVLKRYGTAPRRLWQLLAGSGPHSGFFMDDATTSSSLTTSPQLGSIGSSSRLLCEDLMQGFPMSWTNSQRSPKDGQLSCWPGPSLITFLSLLRGVSREKRQTEPVPAVPPPPLAGWAAQSLGTDSGALPVPRGLLLG